MSDAVRVAFTAATLIVIGLGQFAWRVARTDAHAPDRLVGELRLANLAALVAVAAGAAHLGLALAARAVPVASVDVMAGLVMMVVAGWAMFSEPPASLTILATAFAAHAIFEIAHRPGWLTADVIPRWYAIGAAIFDACLATLCAWVRRTARP